MVRNVRELFAFASLAMTACGGVTQEEEIGQSDERVIYGDSIEFDTDLKEYTSATITPALKLKMDATAATTFSQNVTCDATSCTLSLTAFSSPAGKNLCPDAGLPFANQDKLSAPVCDTFLVGPDLMMTATHCFSDPTNKSAPPEQVCAKTKVLFDFHVNANGTTPTVLPATSVFSCQSIVARGPFPVQDGQDWAIFRVDRVVPGRTAFTLRRNGVIGDGVVQPINMQTAGFPIGLPQKLSTYGTLTRNPSGANSEFEYSLDAFPGNSGGPVWELATGIVDGVHNAGYIADEQQFVFQAGRNCYLPFVCSYDTGCTGNMGTGWERATRVELAQATVPVNSGVINSINQLL